MLIRRLIPTILILLFLATSCGPTSNAIPTSGSSISITRIGTVSGDKTPNLFASPSATKAFFTPTVSPKNLSFQCLQVLVSKPSSLKASGWIILRDYQRNGTLFALDLSNGQTTEILRSSGPHTLAAVSPNRRLLAYRDNDVSGKGDNLVIIDSHFVVQIAIPWQASWSAIVNWINNKQLAILNTDPETRMVILDSVTGQERPVSFSQFPDFSDSVTNPWIEMDPKEQLVLYPIMGDAYSLFDFVGKKSIARLSSWTTESPDASWSTDGGFIAVIGPNPRYYDNLGGSDEIFTIDRNGHVEQITHLSDYYGRNLGLYSPRWSPDGKRLAFWIQHSLNGTMNYVLAVADLVTKSVTNFCVSSDPSGYGGEFHEALPGPIWSPDGKQLIIESRNSEDHSRVVLVDLLNNTAVEIAQDTRPVGWMTSEP